MVSGKGVEWVKVKEKWSIIFLPFLSPPLPWFMRVAHPSAWFQKSNKSPRPPDSDHLSVPPYPTNKGDPRPSSASSFRSLLPSTTSYSNRSTPTLKTHTQDTLSHPFALMAHAPLPVVSSHDSSGDEEDCPVCLEPLSFSFRLPGEKPHIVPECGHALHEVCFFAFIALPSLWSFEFVARALEAQLALLSESLRPRVPVDGDLLFYSTLRSPSTTLIFPPPLLIYVRVPVA
jgi:hypothetical protein